ncbi:MAG: PorV/PorQ family protein [candidate division WOR-3 bacterium]|nr:PorV/PorQ family protein [candidate division WOR-3 bacterium]MCX7757499.1 PorV/PorQ family protein [candidate division WOR-3 bacterium]MDW7987121.1 PorV/PorQ family protein [candidate division WOR-3 bacterium]
MKITMKHLILTIILLSVPLAYGSSPGEAVVSPFEISITARQTAVGEAFTAHSDCNSFLYNPATLSLLECEYLTFSHNRWIVGSSQSFLSGGIPFNWGFLAAGIVYFNQGEIDFYYNWQNQGLRKNNYDLGLILGYGGRFDRFLGVGANIKIIYHDWSGFTMAAYAADVGAVAPNIQLPYEIGVLNAGLVIQNIGPQERLRYSSFNQPLTSKLGVSIDFQSWEMFDFVFLSDLAYPIYDDGIRANFGLEVWGYDILALRIGYRLGYDISKANLTLGAGLKYKNFNFDYALVDYSYSGLTHRFTVCMKFNDVRPVGPLRVIDRKLGELKDKTEKLQADVTDLKLSVDEVKSLIKTSLKTTVDLLYIRHFLNVLFPFNSYTIPKTEYWKIDEAVRLINVYYPNQTIVLEGHTDVAGSDAYNMRLSEKRAQAVKEYMVSKGIPANRIIISPQGENKPLNYQTGPGVKGMENRRVVFVISE